MDAGQILGLIGALSTIILGVIAISLSLYFYRRNSDLSNSMQTLLSRIEASAKVTEVTSKEVLLPIIETILGIARDSARIQIESLGRTFMQRSAVKLEDVLQAKTYEEKEKARDGFINEINSLLGILRSEVGKIGLASEAESRPVVKTEPKPVPGSSPYNWTPFIRKIRDMQNTHKYLSVKWLREKRFNKDPELQEALQISLDRKMLLTYYQDNPKNPNFPTLSCKLNLDHPLVNEILQAISAESGR